MSQHAEAIELIKASQLFDEEWYRSRYPDVVQLSMDPVEHYLKIGAILLRDPSLNFSTSGYLQAYPDLEKAGINPLYHYVKLGKAEGRIAPMSKAAWEDRGAGGVMKAAGRRAGNDGTGTEASAGINRELEQQLAKASKKCKELEEENELLLLQLHQVQEELEEYFMKYQELCPRMDTNGHELKT